MAHSEQPKEHYRYMTGITVCTGDDCEICKDISFIRWVDTVKRNLIVDYNWPERSALRIDEDAWREMYNDGLSVDEAICEEMR